VLIEMNAWLIFYDRDRSEQDEEDLGIAADRVKIKRHCDIDSSHVACSSFRVSRRSTWSIGGWHVANERSSS